MGSLSSAVLKINLLNIDLKNIKLMWLIIVWNRVPSVKVCHGQKWIIYVICRYLYVLHPKMFAPCASPSTIMHVCIISLMLCVNSCMTCGIWYVVCSVLYATCLNSLNIKFVMYHVWINLCRVWKSSVNFFTSSLIHWICKIADSCSKLYVALAKL